MAARRRWGLSANDTGRLPANWHRTFPLNVASWESLLDLAPVLSREHRWIVVQGKVVNRTIVLCVDSQVLLNVSNDFIKAFWDWLEWDLISIGLVVCIFHNNQVSTFFMIDFYIVIDIWPRSIQLKALKHRSFRSFMPWRWTFSLSWLLWRILLPSRKWAIRWQRLRILSRQLLIKPTQWCLSLARPCGSEASPLKIIHTAFELFRINQFCHVNVVHLLGAVELNLQDSVEVVCHVIDVLRQLVKLKIALSIEMSHLYLVRVHILLFVYDLEKFARVHIA